MTKKGEILVVDDSEASLHLIARMLEEGGYSASLAAGGELALAAAESKPPELVLLDVRMPGLDGFEVFRRLKARPGTAEIPVIFLTAGTDPEECVAGLKLGAVDFVSKPFNREGLLAKVGTHVELFRLRKKLQQQALELSAERDRFSTLFQNSNDAVFVHAMGPGNEPGKFIEVNDVACARLGYTREELLALTPADIDASDMDEKRRAVLEDLMRSGRAVFEMYHSAKNGRRILSEISSRVFSYGGQAHLLSIARDITERKRAEALLLASEKSVREKNIAFAELLVNPELKAGNIQAAKRLLTEAAARLAGVARASIWAYSADGRELRCLDLYEAGSKEHSEGLVLNCADYPRYFETLRAKSHIAAADARTHPGTKEFVAGYLAPLGITSMLDGIIPGSSGLEGVFCLEHTGGVREWLPEEENLLSTLSTMAAMVFDIDKHKRMEVRLRESEERYRAVAEYSNNAICILDARGRFIWANARMTEMGGYTYEEFMVADSFARFISPESAEFVLGNFHKFAAGLPYEHHYTFSFLRADGQRRLCEKYMTDYKDRHGSRHLVVSMLDITERMRAEGDRDRLSKAIDQTGEAIVIADLQGGIQYVNPAFEKVTGYSRQEAVGKKTNLLKSGRQDEAFYKDLWEKITSGLTWEGRMVNKRKDGTFYTEDATISPVRDPQGRIINFVAVKKDITGQLQMEEKFRQSQKMETIGLLAGGVAHDFNNILGAIMGYSGFIAKALEPGDSKLGDVKEIMTAAERATALTRQLLAFSRRQIMATRVADINGLTSGMTSLLRRVIGEQIRLELKLYPEACLANVDPGQIEQVIMNLALNARDAMPGGGVVTLATEIIAPPEEFFDTHPDLQKGPLVCLKIGDTGCGMNAEVKSHLFEPFFTTKEQGKGTGLGLSTVFGIVKQSRGEIEVESEPGKGTVFTIYLPLEDARPQDTVKDKPGALPEKGRESVLFVEDEESLRRLGERILRGSGYTVLAAADGQEALKLMEERGRPVDLLMTDVVMPGMSGRELGLELARRKLIGRALYMSGYTDDAIVKHGVLEPGIAFIYKPFTVDAVLLKLREVLDGPVDKAKA